VLVGRERELERLLRALDTARGGGSEVLVVRGEAGMGKTALLQALVASADGMTVLRARGVESEVGVPFAALAELCEPVLALRERLPGAQAAALAGALQLEPVAPQARLAVGAALLGLLGALAAAGLDVAALEPAESAGIVSLGPGEIAFHHPLLRAALPPRARAPRRGSGTVRGRPHAARLRGVAAVGRPARRGARAPARGARRLRARRRAVVRRAGRGASCGRPGRSPGRRSAARSPSSPRTSCASPSSWRRGSRTARRPPPCS
jgi:AAA ATPase domain